MKSERYTDPLLGWSLSYPSDLHLERSGYPTFLTEVTVASFEPRPGVHVKRDGSTAEASFRGGSPLDWQRRFPADGVAFRLVTQWGGPPLPTGARPRETSFPISLGRFEPATSPQAFPGRVHRMEIYANGFRSTAEAWIGKEASSESVDKLRRVVASLRWKQAHA